LSRNQEFLACIVFDRLEHLEPVCGARGLDQGLVDQLTKLGAPVYALRITSFADVTRGGPTVIPLSDATLFVADGWTARALPIGGYLLERTA